MVCTKCITITRNNIMPSFKRNLMLRNSATHFLVLLLCITSCRIADHQGSSDASKQSTHASPRLTRYLFLGLSRVFPYTHIHICLPQPQKKKISDIVSHILTHYKNEKRSFPWRETDDPYHILVSEYMLQQTQTDRVVPKYQSFIKKFPDVTTLASASQREVLTLWSGLGYNRRAIALRNAADEIVSTHDSSVPETKEGVAHTAWHWRVYRQCHTRIRIQQADHRY